MKRLIAVTAVTASLALSIIATSGSTTVAKEGELRNGADDRHPELVGREGEPRNGLDNGPDDKVFVREGELRNGLDNGTDDKGAI